MEVLCRLCVCFTPARNQLEENYESTGSRIFVSIMAGFTAPFALIKYE